MSNQPLARVRARGLNLLLAVIVWIPSSYAIEADETSRRNEAPLNADHSEQLGGLPIAITSVFADGLASGVASGPLDFPFADVDMAFRQPAAWCAMLTLHLNVKACTVVDDRTRIWLRLFFGPKDFQSAKNATQMDYEFELEKDAPDQLKVRLHASRGPMGTRDYEITLSVTSQDDLHTLVTLKYQYKMGTRGKLAMQSYLNTIARAKIGFTASEQNGGIRYVSGIRGMTERNVMRYYFAIMAHLECLVPPSECTNNLVAASRWFDFTERFPQQLHELSKDDYLRNKRLEFQQQRRLQKLADRSRFRPDDHH